MAPIVPLTVQTAVRFYEQVAFISEVGGTSLTQPGARLPPELLAGFFGGWFPRQGWVLRCDEFAGLSSTSTVKTFKAYVAGKGFVVDWSEVKTYMAFAVLVDAQKNVRAFSLTTDDTAEVSEYTIFEDGVAKRRLPNAYASLSERKVAIVGLGSVGSKVAVSLARSGVGKFVLVDDDIVLPENLVRNQLDWLSVGFSKAQSTRGAIQLVNPAAQVSARLLRVAGQENASSNAAVLEAIAACDLVVDATSEDHVFTSLAAMCRRRERALVWGEVFAGGIGALMARSVPGRDADPLTVRAAVNSYLDTLPEAPFKNAGGYDDVPLDGQALVAGDAELSQLAGSMTAFAIDALVGADAPRFPVAAYLFGYTNGWSAFQAPFDTHAIDCPKASEAPREDDGTRLEALKELANVFAKSIDADGQSAE
jgi:molybdopterin/thiamine biosynthesis adenylyltransferase